MSDPYLGPNEEVLEAQRRVCTGPHQSRPLGKKEGDPDPKRILELIFASLKGALPRAEQASPSPDGRVFCGDVHPPHLRGADWLECGRG